MFHHTTRYLALIISGHLLLILIKKNLQSSSD